MCHTSDSINRFSCIISYAVTSKHLYIIYWAINTTLFLEHMVCTDSIYLYNIKIQYTYAHSFAYFSSNRISGQDITEDIESSMDIHNIFRQFALQLAKE